VPDARAAGALNVRRGTGGGQQGARELDEVAA
jgi:hypothetical protein